MTTATTTAPGTRLNYGLDAPGLVRGFFITGTMALVLMLPAAFGFWPPQFWGVLLAAVLVVCAGYCLSMGSFMLYSSRVGKVRERERLLDLISWRGHEQVLDVGCGRGLMLIGVAKRLPAGRAVGIDIWQAADQADNRPEAALHNARLEGVAERIEVQTADMRELPFANGSFDAVVSHWSVHNLAQAAERAKALREMSRVLKPGGQVILADIEHQAEYRAGLSGLGFVGVELVGESVGSSLLRALSFGSFYPTAVIARKPVGAAVGEPTAARAA